MKTYISIIILFIAVISLGIWDGIHTKKVFDYMESESSAIYTILLTTEISDENVKSKIDNLNDYWTKEMDILCISISRKDLQSISDYLQYLYSASINNNQEDAITYSRLLNYNLTGLNQITGTDFLNII